MPRISPTEYVNKHGRLLKYAGQSPYRRLSDGKEVVLLHWTTHCEMCEKPLQFDSGSGGRTRVDDADPIAPPYDVVPKLDDTHLYCGECRSKIRARSAHLAAARKKAVATIKKKAAERREIKRLEKEMDEVINGPQRALERALRASEREHARNERRKAKRAEQRAEREARKAQAARDLTLKRNGAMLSDQQIIDLRARMLAEAWVHPNQLIWISRLAKEYGLARASLVRILNSLDRDLEKDPVIEDIQYRALKDAEENCYLTNPNPDKVPTFHGGVYGIVMRGDFRRKPPEVQRRWVEAGRTPEGL